MELCELLDLATDLGYELAMSGAETFRVEESISRVLAAYGIAAEVFAIPNFLVVSTIGPDGTPITRMRRIGFHGNDLDSVERFSALSRGLCARTPAPEEARRELEQIRSSRRFYPTPMRCLGDFLGAGGFGLFFGGSWVDGVCAGLCGILVGLVNRVTGRMKVNPFFSTLTASSPGPYTHWRCGAGAGRFWPTSGRRWPPRCTPREWPGCGNTRQFPTWWYLSSR